MDTVEREVLEHGWAHPLVGANVHAPLALSNGAGVVLCATPAAIQLLRRVDLAHPLPARLPPLLWEGLAGQPQGTYLTFQPLSATEPSLELARYAVDGLGFLLLLRPMAPSSEPAEWALGRRQLAASVAHDLYASLASLIYCSDFLGGPALDLGAQALLATVREIADAGRRLQLTADGLLDFASVGPAISVPVFVPELLRRTQRVLCRLRPSGPRRLRLVLGYRADWVSGNPVVVEQVLTTLLVLASDHAVRLRVVTGCRPREAQDDSASELSQVAIEVGPDPLQPVSPGPRGAALTGDLDVLPALTEARAEAEGQGGTLHVHCTPFGPKFELRLPRSKGS